MDTKSFYRKWNNKTLEDAGAYVSKEYSGFQTSLTHLIQKLAVDCGGVVVHITKGHYFESFMIERDGKFCYINHEQVWQRSTPKLGENQSFLIRTAEHREDWRGGVNQYCSIFDLPTMIDKILNEKHIRF